MSRRTLMLLRHAKSGYPDDVEDHDRPLTPRGEADAAAVAPLLRELWPDVVLCSTAARARATWELIEAALDQGTTVRYERDLYLASPRGMLGLIRGVSDQTARVLVVAHNPGVQELAVSLAGNRKTAKGLAAKFGTAALAVFAVTGSWRDLETADLVDFHTPRG